MDFHTGEPRQPGRFSEGVCLRRVQSPNWANLIHGRRLFSLAEVSRISDTKSESAQTRSILVEAEKFAKKVAGIPRSIFAEFLRVDGIVIRSPSGLELTVRR
jgi:hypothetical protein